MGTVNKQHPKHYPPKVKEAMQARQLRKAPVLAVELLGQLFSVKPTDRPSAAQALQHPWCANKTKASADQPWLKEEDRSRCEAARQQSRVAKSGVLPRQKTSWL